MLGFLKKHKELKGQEFESFDECRETLINNGYEQDGYDTLSYHKLFLKLRIKPFKGTYVIL